MNKQHCIILGGGHAAAQLAPSLRQQGWDGDITLVSDEGVLPYQRPPLSKGYLLGTQTLEQILIKGPKVYEKAAIQLKLSVRCTQIDRQKKQLYLDNGEVLNYDKLALTLGSRVRQLDIAGAELTGVFYLKTLEDLDRIKSHANRPSTRRAVIIGGGYIGLETAAVLRKLGMEVTVLEAMSRILQRVTTPDVSAFYHRIHTEEGVTICCDKTVSTLAGTQQITAVHCTSGDVYPADLVIIGIGVIPNTELAEAAGLSVNNGILINDFAVTSDPDIVAAGDCASFVSQRYGRSIRLESVPNAMAQATSAAASICDIDKQFQALPWFWSDQYDLKLQIAGLSQGHDQVVIRGDLARGRELTVFYLKEGRILSLDCVNRPKDFMIGKKLIESAQQLDTTLLSDEAIDLGTLLK
ncbi:NAD(P)/FAD-dependent oxidoreductase [Vibrio sp. MEBiC08052]|uniref:NAD(P)/FAD-dependent oxidoreductase n=1 Tax=Vibrio sp. MEBiC08052 TaxID=1761910 RepID=UPI0007408577|nr:FAD-dependent oxidoreductase [Vibrio sp. MEBiC08052]KUI98603.1 ferredoxin reductase [Vibrio sp. MEBiC08052]